MLFKENGDAWRIGTLGIGLIGKRNLICLRQAGTVISL